MKTNESDAAWRKQRDWTIRLSVGAVASLIAAAVGPFTTYEVFSFFERALFWGALIMGFVFPAYWLRIVSRRFLTGSTVKQDVMGAVIQAVVLGPLVWVFNQYVMNFDLTFPRALLEHMGGAFLIFLAPVAIRGYWQLTLYEDEQAQFAQANPTEAAVATIPMTAPAAEPAAPPAMEHGLLVRRLEPNMQGTILRLSADDHQLLVQTDKGLSRLRFRLSDAVEELPEQLGVRVHRSHWVAKDNIASFTSEGRRHMLQTHCGANLPVSPTGLKNLEEAGLSLEECQTS